MSKPTWTNKPWVRRAGAALLVTAAFFGVIFWKIGALAGTYEANYLARAALLARDESLREKGFPELAAGGGDFAEVFDRQGQSIWKSAGLAQRGGALPSRPTTRLTECDLSEAAGAGLGSGGLGSAAWGAGTWGIVVPTTLPGGEERLSAYVGSKSGYYAGMRWVVGWLSVVFLFPSIAFVLLHRGRGETSGPT